MKKLLSFILILFLSLNLCACKKKIRSLILFNNNHITKETLLKKSNEFKAGKRIYFIFMTKKPLPTETIRIKIFKRTASARNSVTGLVYCKEFKLKKDNIYYYTDYIVLHNAGDYCMMIY